MLRRLVALSVLLLVALAPAALAANVKIRVEGKTTTIFGPSPKGSANISMTIGKMAIFGSTYTADNVVSSIRRTVRLMPMITPSRMPGMRIW